MATSTVAVKSAGTALFTIQNAASSAITNGPSTNIATKWAGTVYVRMGRTSSAAFGSNLPVFRIMGSPSGSGKDWVPVFVWTPALGAQNTSCFQSLTATANSGATAVVVSAAPNASTSGTDLFLFNTSAVARSEWNRIALANVTTVLAWGLERTQTAAKCIVASHGESWAIPVDFSGMTGIMFQVDNSAFNVASGLVVEATMVATENAYTAP